jgi:hypothetical protein
MMNIKSTWFYSILIASVLGGTGIGYVAAPSSADMERSMRQAQERAMRDCQPARTMPRGPVYNSQAKDY